MAVDVIEGVPLAKVGAMLGEGPIWSDRDRTLWFVDIKAPRIHRLDPATGRLRAWDAPDQIGWILPTRDGRFLVGLAGGLHFFTPGDGGFVAYRPVEADRPGNRLNDAAVDPAGRVWFGSMDDREAAATGRLYVLDDGIVRDSRATPVVITNGPAISPDGRTLYAVDTLGRSVQAYSLGGNGQLGMQRPFLSIDPALGHPDGAICDAEGGIWVAFWGGSAARRYDTDGTPTHEVHFPTANITKIAIGGPDGRTGYATSARKGLDAAALAEQPHAGDIFTFPAPFAGLPGREAAIG